MRCSSLITSYRWFPLRKLGFSWVLSLEDEHLRWGNHQRKRQTPGNCAHRYHLCHPWSSHRTAGRDKAPWRPWLMAMAATVWMPLTFWHVLTKALSWLAVTGTWIWFSYSVGNNHGNVIIPIDELLFFRGVAQPPTSLRFGHQWSGSWSWVWPRYSRRRKS